MAAIAAPLFARLSNHARWPNRLTLITFLAAQAAGIALATLLAYEWRPITVAGIRLYGMMRGNLMVLIILLVVTATPGFVAAQMVARDASRDDFQVMRLTMLSSWQIIQTYLLAALHRTRLVVAVALGAMAYFPAARLIDWLRDGGGYGFFTAVIPVVVRVPVDWASSMVSILAVAWLGAMSGVWLGLSIRRVTVAPFFGAAAGIAVLWMMVMSSLAVSRIIWTADVPREQRFLISYIITNSWFFVSLGLVGVMYGLAFLRLKTIPGGDRA